MFEKGQIRSKEAFMKKIVVVNIVLAIFFILVFSGGFQSSVPTVNQSAPSGEFYVAKDGSDHNPGTLEEPWQTIQKAASSVGPGSTVFIEEGTYFERINIEVSGTEEEGPILFTNYNEGQVVLDGTKSSPEEQGEMVRIENQNYIRIENLDITNNVNQNQEYRIGGIGIVGNSSNIEIVNCKIHHIWYTGSRTEGEAQAIGIYGTDAKKTMSEILLEGNEIWDIKCGNSPAVLFSGNIDGFSVKNNEIHDANQTALALLSGIEKDGTPISGDKEQNRVRNGVIKNNEIYENQGGSNICFGEDTLIASGIHISGGESILIHGNACYENDYGILVDSLDTHYPSKSIEVTSNLIYQNNGWGIELGSKKKSTGFLIQSAFTNNTLYNNDLKQLGTGEIVVGKSHDITIGNNIVYAGKENKVVVLEQLGVENIYNTTFTYNLYYGPSGPNGIRFLDLTGKELGLRAWQAATKQDIYSKLMNPRFIDLDQKDFQLSERSPAIDGGNSKELIGEGATDFIGNPRLAGAAIDCGAYEFQ